jgi:hypothetical protein
MTEENTDIEKDIEDTGVSVEMDGGGDRSSCPNGGLRRIPVTNSTATVRASKRALRS